LHLVILSLAFFAIVIRQPLQAQVRPNQFEKEKSSITKGPASASGPQDDSGHLTDVLNEIKREYAVQPVRSYAM
jgi:hypothetical protein